MTDKDLLIQATLDSVQPPRIQPNDFKISNATSESTKPNLKVGDVWFVKLQNAQSLWQVKVSRVYNRVVHLIDYPKQYDKGAHYKIDDVEFIEKLNDDSR